MASVAIVTDSTCHLPDDLVADKGIGRVSLYVNFPDGRVEREQDLDLETFYDDLVREGESPDTSPPTVEDFVAVYEPLLEQGRSIVSVHISSGLSQSCKAAREAAGRLALREKGGERVEVVDTATAAGPLGLLVLAASAAAAAGEDAKAVAERVRAARQTLGNRFVLDTLEYLRRGGRVGGTTAWLGSRLDVKPILSLEAEIRAVERVRTAEKAFERLVEYANSLHATGADAWVVQHVRAADTAARLVDRCQDVFRRPPVFVSELLPVIGIHTGPGLLGVFGVDPKFLE